MVSGSIMLNNLILIEHALLISFAMSIGDTAGKIFNMETSDPTSSAMLPMQHTLGL